MEVIQQFIKVYYEEEYWHKNKLSEEEAYKYHKTLLEKGRILYVADRGKLLGYVESWRLTYEQLGRVICGAPFSAYLEDVSSGVVAYVANTWIHKDHRKSGIYKTLRDGFYKSNIDCEYFVGDARRKYTGLIKVFKNRRNDGKRENHTSKPTSTNDSYANSYASGARTTEATVRAS